jgi:membrane protease YdiL (CAAX protease family)
MTDSPNPKREEATQSATGLSRDSLDNLKANGTEDRISESLGSTKGGPIYWWNQYIWSPLCEAHVNAMCCHDDRPQNPAKDEKIDLRVVVVCVIVVLNLTFLQYFGMSDKARDWGDLFSFLGMDGVSSRIEALFTQGESARLNRLFYWSGSCLFFYLVVPGFFVVLLFKQRLTDYGLGFKQAANHFYLYIGMFLVVLPFIWLASSQQSFQEQYPFYRVTRNGLPPGFFYWELAYAMQFFALEFFFRGFIVHGLKRRIGAYSILVMVIPYCMIHFGKPFPETLGALIAGLVLGGMSLVTGTIWLGVLIHVSVAWTMDFFALWRLGMFH